MKLYYSPLACSLAGHIALLEAGAEFEREQVNLKTKLTATGDRISDLTGKGYVPALALDGGAIITENIAVLDWIASRYTDLGLSGLWAARGCWRRFPSFPRRYIAASSRTGI